MDHPADSGAGLGYNFNYVFGFYPDLVHESPTTLPCPVPVYLILWFVTPWGVTTTYKTIVLITAAAVATDHHQQSPALGILDSNSGPAFVPKFDLNFGSSHGLRYDYDLRLVFDSTSILAKDTACALGIITRFTFHTNPNFTLD
ncbi:hypothetical protein EVAR_21983_1 [Eumeta japonica]|uniref:Uncharacterized protein n=1 Tax=Eumeta variegata TaxID=151549 RepID=A0A4C1VY01_EUMVA|nr:hypothetical protein EVAR_21983_1 [Eumeta japonica]